MTKVSKKELKNGDYCMLLIRTALIDTPVRRRGYIFAKMYYAKSLRNYMTVYTLDYKFISGVYYNKYNHYPLEHIPDPSIRPMESMDINCFSIDGNGKYYFSVRDILKLSDEEVNMMIVSETI